MSLSPIRESDSEPLNRTVKLRFSHRQLEDLDAVAAELGMARSWVLRRRSLLVFRCSSRRSAGCGTRVRCRVGSTSIRIRGVGGADLARTGSVRVPGSMLLSGAAAGDDVRGRDRAGGWPEPFVAPVRIDNRRGWCGCRRRGVRNAMTIHFGRMVRHDGDLSVAVYETAPGGMVVETGRLLKAPGGVQWFSYGCTGSRGQALCGDEDFGPFLPAVKRELKRRAREL